MVTVRKVRKSEWGRVKWVSGREGGEGSEEVVKMEGEDSGWR
jgi:hypothetical protein